MAMLMFNLMKHLRFLRGSVLDPFRNTAEMKLARQLIKDYEADIEFALANSSAEKADAIAKLLDLPEQIRGYGHIRQRHADAVALKRKELYADVLAREIKAA